MSTEQEQFNKLRLLLTVKRYEQPPPGYFNRLPSNIIAQIRAEGRHAEVGFGERLAWSAPWLQRMWQFLETKPVFAGSLGVAVCALLLAGVGYYTNPEPVAENFVATPANTLVGNSGGSLVAVPSQLSGMPGLGSPVMVPQTILASTGGVYNFSPGMPRTGDPYIVPVMDRR